MEHLEAEGYKLTDDWRWVPPKSVTLENMPERDFFAILFLQQEWDYGGIADETR